MEKAGNTDRSNLFVSSDLSLAYALLRVTLGINIALHGITRIAAGMSSFAATLTKQFAGTPLPHFAVLGFGYVLPWAEAIIGLLILFGAWTRAVLIAGALVLAALTFGTCLIQDWSVAGLQLIYAVVYFILIAAVRYNRLATDRLWSRDQE